METIAPITGWDYIPSALNTVALFWRNGMTKLLVNTSTRRQRQ
jgi:hypothetical protein